MNSQRQPLVSVVTPVYNGEDFLRECIESVVTQTYQHWEYIINNNCSTDRTGEIAESYARKDARIRVYRNAELVKMSPNHDIALSRMSPASEFCKVLHADDFMFPECLERMVNLAVANPSVGVVSSYRLDDRYVNLDGLPYPSTVVPGRELCRKFLKEGLFVFGSPSSLLIRSDLIRGRKIFIDDDTFFMHGDVAACHEMLMTSDFGFVHQVLTFTGRPATATDTPRAILLNSYVAAYLMVLKRYGPFYLNPAEYEELLAARMKEYYGFLGKSLIATKDAEFWKFHYQALKAIGFPLSFGRLARASLAEEKRAFILHPFRSLGRMIEVYDSLRRQTSYETGQ